MTLDQLAAAASMSGPAPRSHDWDRVTAEFGYPMPADYAELIDNYGGGVLCDYIRIYEPQAAKATHDLVKQTQLRRGDLQMFWSRGVPKPDRLSNPGVELVNWADTVSGEYLYWLADKSLPSSKWTVALESSEDNEWEFFDSGCVDFLTGVVTADTTSFYLDDLTEDEPPSFRSYRS